MYNPQLLDGYLFKEYIRPLNATTPSLADPYILQHASLPSVSQFSNFLHCLLEIVDRKDG